MRGKLNLEQRAECIRLRLEERLSYKQITARTGIGPGSLSQWLKPYPLTQEEMNSKKIGRTWKKYRGEESKYHNTCNPKDFTRSQKNKIAEAAVLFRLVLHGFEVFGSVFDGDKTDWLVRMVGSKDTKRVEVKWASSTEKHGLPFMRLHCTEGHGTHRRYKDDEFDVLAGYDFFTDTAYVYTPADIAHLKVTVAVSPEYAERWEKLK